MALVVAAVLIAIAVPAGAAAVAGDPGAATSAAARPAKALKRLSTQLKALRQRIVTLEAGIKTVEAERNAPRVPSGPAGGALAGAYPNPQLAPSAVGTANLQTGSVGATQLQAAAVGATQLQDGAVGATKLAPNAVTAATIADRAVQRNDIATGAVGPFELGRLIRVSSPGVVVSPGESRLERAICPAGTRLISGGHRWSRQELNFITWSMPSETVPDSTWEVRAGVGAGTAPNTLFAHALCLSG